MSAGDTAHYVMEQAALLESYRGQLVEVVSEVGAMWTIYTPVSGILPPVGKYQYAIARPTLTKMIYVAPSPFLLLDQPTEFNTNHLSEIRGVDFAGLHPEHGVFLGFICPGWEVRKVEVDRP